MKLYLIKSVANKLSCTATDTEAGPKRDQTVKTELQSASLRDLASGIMGHFYGADQAALAEAKRKTPLFYDAFLGHHKFPKVGGQLYISGDVLNSWLAQL